MKKMALFLVLILSLSMTTVCLVDEAAEDVAVVEETENAESAPGQDIDINSAVGKWQKMGTAGMNISFPSAIWYIYPDGTATDNNQEISVSLDLQEDGSFTADLSGIEEYAEYTVTGEVMPVSEDDLELYKALMSEIYVSYNTDQLILTITYPDPTNPLASEPAVSTVLLLRRTTSLADMLENYMIDTTWKIGENILVIDSEQNLDLNDGASTGRFMVSSDNATAPADHEADPFNAKVTFKWTDGGTVNYLPVVISADRIELQNMDKPEEVLVLESMDDPVAEAIEDIKAAVAEVIGETADAVEEAADAVEEAADAAEDAVEEAVEVAENPFAGKWELATVTKGDEEIPAEELLQDDGMTAEVADDGQLTLTFTSSGVTVVIEPVYDGNILTAHYGEFDSDMDWTASLKEDDVVAATYEDYTIILNRVQ